MLNAKPIIPIEEYLELTHETIHKLSELLKYTKIHHIYDMNTIKCFYQKYAFYEIDFGLQKITVTEILNNCKELISFVDSNLYLDMISYLFIIKNGLLNDFCRSKTSPSDFLKNNTALVYRNYEFRIKKSEKTLDLLRESKIEWFMIDCNEIDIRFQKNTFKNLLNNKKIDIPALMAYNDLDSSEINILTTKIINDSEFKNNCIKFIKDQGILNNTMQIISSLCNLNMISVKFDSDIIHNLYCAKHSELIYLPFNTFKPVGNLSMHQIYLLYLSNKKTLIDDIDDIILSIKSCDKLASVSLFPDTIESDSIQFSPVDCNINKKKKSIQSEIFNLLLKTNTDVKFDRDLFKYLPELEQEEYFENICKKYADEILDSNIFNQIPECLISIKTVVDFIKKMNESFSSFESIQTDILFSSIGGMEINTKNEQILENVENQKNEIPCLIRFNEYSWLKEQDKINLLETYISKYDINELIDNLISVRNITPFLQEYVENNLYRIADLKKKMIICHKLKIKCENVRFSDVELKNMIEIVDDLINLKEYLYSTKTTKNTVILFLSKLSHTKIDEIITDLESKKVCVGFLSVFIDFISDKYEFIHIYKLLNNSMDYHDVEIVKTVQKYLLKLLNSQFVDETYISSITALYSKMIGFTDVNIRKNNDKIVVMVGKIAKMMEKAAFIGNIKRMKPKQE